MARSSVCVGKGLPTYNRARVGRESFPDAMPGPSVVVGKGLPTFARDLRVALARGDGDGSMTTGDQIAVLPCWNPSRAFRAFRALELILEIFVLLRNAARFGKVYRTDMPCPAPDSIGAARSRFIDFLGRKIQVSPFPAAPSSEGEERA